MKKKFFIVAVFVILALVGIGCEQLAQERMTSDQSHALEADPITIGWLGPLTGDAAVYGEMLKNVNELATKEINDAGGIRGRNIEFVYEDAKCEGKSAASAMQKLVDVDKVQIVIGGVCSGESLAAASIANDEKVILISAGSTSPELTQAGDFIFRTIPSDDAQGKVLAAIAHQKKGWKRVGVIQEQTDAGVGLLHSFRTDFEPLGGIIVLEAFPVGTSDFRTPLSKLKAANVDVLFIITQTENPARLIVKQLQELNWKPELMANDIFSGFSFVREEPVWVEGMLVAQYVINEGNEKLENMLLQYKTMFGVEPEYPQYVQVGYDTVYLLAEGLGEVDYNGEKLRDWLYAKKGFKGASGELSFDKNGDREVGGHKPMIIKDGVAVLLD